MIPFRFGVVCSSLVAVVPGVVAVAMLSGQSTPDRPSAVTAADPGREAEDRGTPSRAVRRDFVRRLRVHGTVEAVHAATISAPRLAGSNSYTLVVTRLARNGTLVRRGEPLIEFDRQEQVKTAFDRRAECLDLEQQILKKKAQHRTARAADEAELAQAANAVARAILETAKNELSAKIVAEKNRLALEEAQAKLTQLREVFDLKRKAAAADLRILEIRRDRALSGMHHAERNMAALLINAPLDGLLVVKSIWKGSGMAQVQEGEEVRAGVPVLQVVDPALMQVRATVNQSDIPLLSPGQPVRVSLDAYPDLTFSGRVDHLGPIGVAGQFSDKVRTFVAVVSIAGHDHRLTPDLSAAIDVEVARHANVIVIPRSTVTVDGTRATVCVPGPSGVAVRDVRLAAMSDDEAVVESGLQAGDLVERCPNAEGGR